MAKCSECGETKDNKNLIIWKQKLICRECLRLKKNKLLKINYGD